MSNAASATSQQLARAYLEIKQPKVADPVIPLRFNPSEYQLQKQNNFAEIAIPGLNAPPIQFIRGAAERLTADVLVDTSETLEDVRERYVNKLRKLLDINGQLHAPPIVSLVWDTQLFVGVLESLTVTYQLFRPDGVPMRAKLAIALKEYRPTAVQAMEQNKSSSPDVEKQYTVRRGDTLSAIAGVAYNDPTLWRPIADANGIVDPRRLEPGRVLLVPPIR